MNSATVFFHWPCASLPSSARSAKRARTSSGTKNGVSGQPKWAFVAATSFAPRGSPWALFVSCFGEPMPMWVRATMSDGRDVAAPVSSARWSDSPICAWSWPSMCWTNQPYASYRLPTSSEKARS